MPRMYFWKKIGFKSSLAHSDVWYKLATDETGFYYYTYVMFYVDDILIVDNKLNKYMDMLEEYFTVKPSSIGWHKVYLIACIGKLYYPDESYAWKMIS